MPTAPPAAPPETVSLPPAPHQKSKPFSLRHWQWRLGQDVIARVPALRRRFPVYRNIASAYESAEVRGCTEKVDMPQTELCRRFKSQSDFEFDLSVTRRTNLLILRYKTVLGATGRIVDERAETLLRFMGEHDHVNRNDFALRRMRVVTAPDGLYFNLLGAHKGHEHLYHFMFERLKPLYYFLKDFDRPHQNVQLLVRARLPDYQQRVFRVIAEEHRFLHLTPVQESQRWRIGTLAHVDTAQNALPAYSDPGFLQFLRGCYLRAFAVDPKPQARRRIFISRGDAKLRRFTNRHLVHRVLQHHGFEIMEAARLSFREQIETFRDAALIAGTHGAGLTNILFAPPDVPLIEFFPSNRMKPTYLQLSLAQRRPYYWLRGGPGDRRQHFCLDPEELDRMLSAILPAGTDSG